MKQKSVTESEQSLSSKTFESMVWFTSLPLLLNIIRFANSILLARLLEPRDFGIVGVASILVYYTNNLSNFGLGNAIVQRRDINDDHLNTFFTMNLGISLLLCFIFLIASPWMANFFKMEELTMVIMVFSSIFIITSFHTIAHTKLRRELEFKSIALNEVTKVMISMPVSLLLGLYGFGYWALICAMLVSTLIATITINLRAKFTYKLAYTKKAFRDLLNFASWNFFSVQVRLLSEYIDKLVIGKISGATMLGYYEKSFGIAQMPYEQMANKLGAIAFSTFSRCQNNQEELRYYFRRMLSLLTFMAFPIFFGLLAITEPFVIVLLGEKWTPMIPSFKFLLVAFLVSSLSSIFSTLNVTCGSYKTDILMRATCLAGLLVILPLVARSGIAAVSMVVLGHNILFLLLAVALSRRVVQLKWGELFAPILPALVGGMLMFLSVRAFSIFVFSSYSLFHLVLMTLVGSTIYIAWFLFTRFREWAFLREKLKILFRKSFRWGKSL